MDEQAVDADPYITKTRYAYGILCRGERVRVILDVGLDVPVSRIVRVIPHQPEGTNCVRIPICQWRTSEHTAENGISLGTLELVLPEGCRNLDVLVTFDLQKEGILQVRVHHLASNVEESVRVVISEDPQEYARPAWKVIPSEPAPREESWPGIRAWLRELCNWPEWMGRWLGPRS